jgi:tyrosine-protein phosphatase YwqE
VRTAWSLLRSGRVDLLASDAHDVRARPSKLRSIEAAVSSEFGSDHWQTLTWSTPSRLLPALAGAVSRRSGGRASDQGRRSPSP